jgi:hypothetical protein
MRLKTAVRQIAKTLMVSFGVSPHHKQVLGKEAFWFPLPDPILSFVIYFDGCTPTLRYRGIKRSVGLSTPGKFGLILFVVVAGLTAAMR